jgi:ATP-binding cassette subfamily C protein CydC
MAASAYILSAAALHPSVAVLQTAIVGVRFFGISRGVFRYLERLASHSVNLRLLAEFRIWLYGKLERLVPGIIHKRRGGDLLALLTADIDTLENLFVRIIAPPITAFLVMVGMFIFLQSQGNIPALIYLIGVFIGGVFLPGGIFFFSRRAGREYVHSRAELNSRLVLTIQSAREILLFGIQVPQMEGIKLISRRFGQAQMALARVSGLGSGGMTWIVNLTILGVLSASIPLVRAGSLEGVLLAVVTLMTAASFEAILPLTLTTQFVSPVITAGRRMFAVADETPQVKEPIQPATMPAAFGLEISGLSFKYPGSEVSVLNGINISIPSGKRIAIVGPSGSGKSTLVNLLTRSWEYSTGSIRIGGTELNTLASQSIYARISILAQTPVILTDTLRRNLLIGDLNAKDDDLVKSLYKVELGSWYKTLPQGLDTWLGERGAKMSGGERQRLAIARLNLRNSQIQIYDEPTANLDPEAERQIFNLVMNGQHGNSIIWVTHRLLSLGQMDEVIFIEHGKIIERGTQTQLLALGGRFAQFNEIQNSWLD